VLSQIPMVFDSYIKSQSQRPKHTARLPVILAITMAIAVPAAALVVGLWSKWQAHSLAVSEAAAGPAPSVSPPPPEPPVPAPDEGPALSEWAPIPKTQLARATSPATTEQLAARTDLERSNQDFGPFAIDGHAFTVRVSLICLKGAQPNKSCDANNTTAESLQVLDEGGNLSYSERLDVSLPDPGAELVDGTEVQAARFNGKEHTILALAYQNFPSAPGTGGSFRFLAMRDGSLTLMNSEPVSCGEAGSFLGVSKGKVPETNLLPGEVLNITDNNHYFVFYRQLRVNWNDFRLEEKVGGDFEVWQEAATLEAQSTVQVFASADTGAAHSALTLPRGTRVEFLDMRIPSDGHEWLKVRINGKEGWITGNESYQAVGLQMFG